MFEILKAYTHFLTRQNLFETINLQKCAPYSLNSMNVSCCSLNERLFVDERIIPYFGKHRAKQYLRGKPFRFGYKMWCLCDRLGYLIQCEPYQGATGIHH